MQVTTLAMAMAGAVVNGAVADGMNALPQCLRVKFMQQAKLGSWMSFACAFLLGRLDLSFIMSSHHMLYAAYRRPERPVSHPHTHSHTSHSRRNLNPIRGHVRGVSLGCMAWGMVARMYIHTVPSQSWRESELHAPHHHHHHHHHAFWELRRKRMPLMPPPDASLSWPPSRTKAPPSPSSLSSRCCCC